MARLILRHKGGESEYRIAGVATIGRQATNDIPVLDDKASRHHARVVPEAGRFFLEDLGSANGTLLNGAPVHRHPLKHGDVIRIGKARLMFYEDRAQELEGQTVGNYRVHRRIGSDGMGTVYKATQLSMDRTVALKILSEELTLDRKFLKDFLRQARAAARLSHSNIVRVYDFGEADGRYYFSMEFVEGEGLDAILGREGKIPLRRALEIVRQTASALDHAHAGNVIHRDIKPENILIDSNGTVKLMDLGLAALAGHRSGGDSGREAMGAPEYMPPEVAQRKSVDPRADIYSLGATFFHMVTGRPPYEGSDPAALIAAHARDPIPSPAEHDASIPDSVCRLIETMMSKNPAMRPAPASVLVEKIDDILEKDVASVEKPAVPSPGRPKSARAPRRKVLRVPAGSPATYALMGALAVAIIGVMAFVFMGRTGGRRPSKGGRSRTSRGRDTGASGTSASGSTARSVSRTDPYRADPEARARTEREAASRLAEIKERVAQNPKAKQWIGRSLYRLIIDFRGTAAAAEARRIYLDLVGEERAGDVLNSLPPGPEGNDAPAGPVDEKEAQEAFSRARLASLKAEADGEFGTARRVLTTFVTRYRGSRREPEAHEDLEKLDGRIHRELDRLYRRAEKASSRGDFREAGPLLREIIAGDPVGPDRRRARELLRANDTAAAAVYGKALDRAAPHFKSFDFDEAARVLREAAPELVGTGYTERLAAAIDCAGEGRKLLGRAAEKLAVTRSRPPVFKRRSKSGRESTLKVLDATPKGLRVGEGPVERVVPWAELTSGEIVAVFELMPLTSADRLSLGAILIGRGSWLPARRQLERAKKDAVIRKQAERFLAQVDVGMKTERFDFSHFDQGAAWETEAGSKWSVRGGAFVHEGSGVGSATLKTHTYRAADFFVRFEVTFLEPIGALEVQIGSGEETVWFSLGSSGYEARSSAGGGEAKARGEWEMRPNVPHKVVSRTTSDKLAISVDGKPLPTLDAPGLGRIEGRLTFRAQGARLELDNVEIRQIR